MSSKYNYHTTGSELVGDLGSAIKGKVILTTGVSPLGLGTHFAKAIAVAQPGLLILTGRNSKKPQQIADEINKVNHDVKTRVLTLDLSSLESVRNAATEVMGWEDVPVIDVLVNNAGIFGVDYAVSPEGHELHFATNHLGHFLFTNLIMSKILAASEPRVVNVSSDGHRLSPIRFGDLGFSGGQTYDRWAAYGQSKTANALFALSLAQKLGGKGLVAVSLHPGAIKDTAVASKIDWQNHTPSLLAADVFLGDEGKKGFSWKTSDQGIATHVFAAFHPSLKEQNGAYLENSRVADPWIDTVKPWATSEVEAQNLWKLSEKLVGQEFHY